MKPPPGSLTMELVSEMYGFLVRHQTEQSQRFDSVIMTREENRIAEEAAERERQEEAERSRLEKEQKEQEELEALLKKGGKGARARIAQIRGFRANTTESGGTELEQATEARKMSTLHARAWPGGHLTRTHLERAFQALPERPSGAQARYLYEQRARYCDETKGQDFLTAEGFTRLVRDLGHLQADLASQKTKKLEQIFKKLDTRRKGEITMGQILAQIETEEQNLLMPLVDALMKTSDTNHNGLLDIREFPAFYFGWMELHRIFEVNDDCRIEEKWIDRETRGGDLLQFAEIELLSSVFQGIKSKVFTGQHQVAQMRPVISSLGEMKLVFIPGTLVNARTHKITRRDRRTCWSPHTTSG
jgi:Ca2+-binding EF-hand superfamily protein